MHKKGFLIAVFLSFVFFLYYFFEISPWDFIYSLKVDKPIPDQLLLAKEKVNLLITPSDDYMGEIHIATNLRGRKNKDDIVFRLKPVSDVNWRVIGIYNTLLIVPAQKASFRFPPIPDSKGKTYLLEFESSSGTENNSVSFYPESDVLIKYQYPRDKFFKGYFSIWHLIQLKINDYRQSQYWIYDLIFIFFPLLLWLFSIFLFNRKKLVNIDPKKVISNKFNWLFIVGLLLVVRLQFFLGYLGSALFLGPWLYLVCERKISPKTGLVASAICTSILPFLLLPRFEDTASYLASITILFLIAYITLEVMNLIEQDLDRLIYLGLIRIAKKAIRWVLPYITRYTSRYVIPYAPYVTTILLSLFVIKDIKSFIEFYVNFYPNNQLNIFLFTTGYAILILDILTIFASIFIFQIKKTKIKFWILVSIILFLVWQANLIAFNKSTFSFRDKPNLWKIFPSETSEAWVDVTIQGLNMSDLPDSGQVIINDMPQRIIKWSSREVTFRTDPNFSTSGDITVIRSDGTRSNKLNFVYEPR